MGYEISKFGDGGYTSGTSNVQSDVSNHYGPREVGGGEGRLQTEGMGNEIVINFDQSGPIEQAVTIPAGAVVTDLVEVGLTGAVATAVVGAIDISGADGTALNYVDITTTGEVEVTGPTAGSVVVKYNKIA